MCTRGSVRWGLRPKSSSHRGVRSLTDFKPSTIAHDQSDQTMTDFDVKVEALIDHRFIRVTSGSQEQR